MPNKNFLLLSLEDAQIKKISNVISNESCRKILDYLSSKEATESELAEKLSIPISTVHYNLQQLTDAGLVSAEEFHYSKKGKEIMHYKLANKYIIIAPKKSFGIREKLKSILPVALIVAGTAGIIEILSRYLSITRQATEAAPMMAKTAAIESADSVMMAAPAAGQEAASSTSLLPQDIAIWFLIGAIFAFFVHIVIDYIRIRKN